MAFENVGVEVFDFAAAHGFDEIAEVILAAAELLDDLALVREGGGTLCNWGRPCNRPLPYQMLPTSCRLRP